MNKAIKLNASKNVREIIMGKMTEGFLLGI